MKCSKCHHENPAKNSYCHQCGFLFQELCRDCKRPNPGASRFCGNCGLELDSTNVFPNDFQKEVPFLLINLLSVQRLSYLIPDLPFSLQADLMESLCKMEPLKPEMLKPIYQSYTKAHPNAGLEAKKLEGLYFAARLMRTMGRYSGMEIVKAVGEDDPDLAKILKFFLPSFKDLAVADKNSLQVLLAKFSNEEVVKAIKTESASMQDLILASVSKGRSKILRDDLELLEFVSENEVGSAQETIYKTAIGLVENGKILLNPGVMSREEIRKEFAVYLGEDGGTKEPETNTTANQKNNSDSESDDFFEELSNIDVLENMEKFPID